MVVHSQALHHRDAPQHLASLGLHPHHLIHHPRHCQLVQHHQAHFLHLDLKQNELLCCHRENLLLKICIIMQQAFPSE